MLSSSDSSDESDHEVGIQINKTFAHQYEKKKRYEELQNNKDLLSEDDNEDDETSESEDDDAVALSTSLDLEIMNTIKLIRTKDPKIYDKSTSFYTKHESNDTSSDESESDTKQTSKKKTFKDVLREQLLEDKEDSDSDDGRNARMNHTNTPKSALLYDKEQESIRKNFLKIAGEQGDSSGESDDDVLLVKPKDPAEQAREEEELRKAIDEVEKLNRADAGSKTEEEQFLANYMRQKKWIDPTASSMRELRVQAREGARVMTVEEEDRLLDLDEDEQELEEVDKFESKYNFRFEELQEQEAHGIVGRVGSTHPVEVAGHSRNVEGSLRRVDDTRKKQREARKERKEKEKRQKEAELRRLKNLKRQELEERLHQIEKVGGKGLKGLDVSLLDEDWDPEKYEREMAAKFGDDYYEQGEDDGDFQPDGEDDLAGFDVDVDEEEGWDDEYEEEEEGEAGEEGYDEEDGEGGDEGQGRELYDLDYEDIVAGLPCRFKYRQVEVDDYGLSIEDILEADDSELNKYVGLKNIVGYELPGSTGVSERQLAKKKKLERKRKQLKKALEERRQQAAEAAKVSSSTKVSADSAERKEDGSGDELEEEATEGKKKRKRKKKKVQEGVVASGESELHVMAPVATAPAVERKEAKSSAAPPLDAHKSSKKKVSKDGKKNSKSSSASSAVGPSKKRRLDLYT